MGKSIYFKLVLLLSVFCSGYFRIYKNLAESKQFFWDSMVYYCGPFIYSQTGAGYGPLVDCSKELINFKFVYLPIYLRILNFYILTPEVFQIIWISILTISVFIIIITMRKIYGTISVLMCLVISIFSFSSIPLYGYISGNISSILYVSTTIGLLLSTSNRSRIRDLGMILITLPSLFKIHMILFLLVPFALTKSTDIKKLFILLISPFIFIVINQNLYPDEFNLLSENIAILPYIGDMGVGSLQVINYIKSNLLGLGAAFKSGDHNWLIVPSRINKVDFLIDYTMYSALVIFIIYRIYKIKFIKLSSDSLIGRNIKFSIAIIGVYLVIPRLKQYDMLICGVPTIYLVNSTFFNDGLKKFIPTFKPKYIILLLNTLILGFYNIKGDNYFIYPIILLIFIVSILSINKMKNDI